MRQITILQVDRCANQLSRTNFSASVYTVERIVFACTRKKGALKFSSRADFVGLIGALVRIRVHVSRTLLRAVWARTEAARGEWGADFGDGYRGKEGFVGRLRYSKKPLPRGGGLLFLLRSGYRPSAEGKRCTFFLTYKKKVPKKK